MPFQSKAQARLFAAKMDRGEISKATFDEWAHSTPGGIDSLPERKTQSKKPTVRNTQSAAGTARRKATAPAPVGRVRTLGRTGTGSRSRRGGRR